MRMAKIAAALLATAGLLACATVRTTVDFDPAADFSRYRTYRWIAAKEPIENEIVQKRLEAAIDRQLLAKGLTPGDPADLLVSIHARLTRETVFRTTGWGYFRGPWRGDIVETHPEEIPIGTLVVDLVDGRSNTLVWRGVARRVLDPEATPEQRARNADETASRLFADYPRPR